MSNTTNDNDVVESAHQYQLFPDLSSDEYEALKADIGKRGVLVPIELDETGAVLDGHHRLRVCRELGITNYPRVVRSGMTEEEKVEHLVALNLERRHLTPDQRREVVAKLKAMGWSNVRIAEKLGVDEGTVRNDAKAGSENSEPGPARVVGKDGKSYPSTRPQPKPSIFTHSPRDEERAMTALQQIGDAAPAKALDLKRAERIVREQEAEQRRSEPVEPLTMVDDVTIHHGDFEEILGSMEPGSVDAIITDPPYTADMFDFGHGLDALAAEAARILKPTGVLAVMFGTGTIPEVTATIGRHMSLRWCVAWLMTGPRARMHHVKVGTGWKPVYLYVPPGAPPWDRWLLDDVILSTGDDKEHHHWGQNADGFRTLVEALTEPGALVVDPFLGGGTTALVCKETGRRFIGCDIDAAAVSVARERVA